MFDPMEELKEDFWKAMQFDFYMLLRDCVFYAEQIKTTRGDGTTSFISWMERADEACLRFIEFIRSLGRVIKHYKQDPRSILLESLLIVFEAYSANAKYSVYIEQLVRCFSVAVKTIKMLGDKHEQP